MRAFKQGGYHKARIKGAHKQLKAVFQGQSSEGLCDGNFHAGCHACEMTGERKDETMTSRSFAQLMGMLFTLVGLLGFVPGLISSPPVDYPRLIVTEGYGLLFGLFPVNAIHNLVHLGVGITGWYSSRSLPAAQLFVRGLTLFYGGLAIVGLFPVLNTTFGLLPLYGHDIWLHAGTAAAAAYFGFGEIEEAVKSTEQYRRAA